jgi:hypothetical protein
MRERIIKVATLWFPRLPLRRLLLALLAQVAAAAERSEELGSRHSNTVWCMPPMVCHIYLLAWQRTGCMDCYNSDWGGYVFLLFQVF